MDRFLTGEGPRRSYLSIISLKTLRGFGRFGCRAGVRFLLGPAGLLLGKFAQGDGNALFLPVTHDREIDRRSRRCLADAPDEFASIRDRLIADGRDDIAGLDAGFVRRAAG